MYLLSRRGWAGGRMTIYQCNICNTQYSVEDSDVGVGDSPVVDPHPDCPGCGAGVDGATIVG